MLSLRRLIDALRVTPDEGDCAERCLEALCDPERSGAVRLGEHEEATIEAERRRWESLHETPRGA
ncbi:MAG TPA: hypothetical protein VK510_01785 [Solirubrobacteraceae bacterium]|jgi:hypothetical protein|nr:hypothetical protein [Solirubrobacteraceae bacterium]